MFTPVRPGDRVTFWIIAENCLCENNGHPPLPSVEPPEEPHIVREARGKLRAAREFDDNHTLLEHHPEAHAALEAHEAEFQRTEAVRARKWVEEQHPMHPGHELREMPCGHLRTLTGYPATVVGRVVDRNPETNEVFVYYQLDVEFHELITTKTKTREVGFVPRQNHCMLAEGRRPESGEFTRGAPAAA